MCKGIFITGTDTDVGKTFVTSLIMKELIEHGVNATYYKSVLSGGELVEGKLIPGDAKMVCQVSGIKEEYDKLVSYTLQTPASPHLAAKLENVDINLVKIRNDFNELKNRYSHIVMEGSGGIICPIKLNDDETILLEDIVKVLNLNTVVVARAGLGTINHTCLTVSYLKSKGIEVKGIIINGYDEENIMHTDNIITIKKLTGVEVIASIPTIKSKVTSNNFFDLKKFISLMGDV